ncbi:MAG TPA: cytochrome c oxidase assembly factor Coa1 family protein [Pyrinomonadaceae bacterium]|nr:cytochrome c oxidase assembly factor Coa1 family protein [Pyrinomonadaceae bacterium]
MYQPQPQYGGGFPPQQQPKGCWGRNWKWIVPTGCLGLLVVVAALGVGIYFVIMSAVRSSDVYHHALEKAKSNPTVVAEMGEPIKDGLLVRGSIESNGLWSHAKFSIPISGPKDSGTVYAEASRSDDTIGDWVFTTLEVEVAGRADRIDLREKNANGVGSEENNNANDEGDASVTGGDEPPPPPPRQPTPPGHTIISGGVLNGKAVSKPEPTYPAIGKAVRAQGTVTVQVTVDEEGNVISASAISGHPLLQPAAVAAARQAKFAPYKLNGQPVKVTGILTYNFVLE